MQMYVFLHECVLACVNEHNSAERSPTWLNSHNHPKAHGRSVGGQVWIGDRRRRRAGGLD